MGSQKELAIYKGQHFGEEKEDNEHEHLTTNDWDDEEIRHGSRKIPLDTEQEIQEPKIHEALQANGSRTPIGRDDLHLIRPGDHIGWHRPNVIWHHAIVVDVDITNRKLQVIHFHGGNKLNKRQNIITEQWIEVDKQKGDLFRFNYEDAYPPHIVIKRARDSVGECGYELLTNNCEHFATKCKTGTPHSAQVPWAREKTKMIIYESVINAATKECVKVYQEMGKQSTKGALKSTVKIGGAEMMERIATRTVLEGTVNVTKGSVKCTCGRQITKRVSQKTTQGVLKRAATKGGVKSSYVNEITKKTAKGSLKSSGKVGGSEVAEKISDSSNLVGAIVIVAMETAHCAYDIYHIHEQYKAGKMTQRDFRVTSTQRVSEGVVGGGAAIGGSILGEMGGAAVGGAIGSAVPVIGTAIGAAVGGFVGSVVVGSIGSFVGNAVGSIFGNWLGNKIW